jgi:hypothetical protein
VIDILGLVVSDPLAMPDGIHPTTELTHPAGGGV